MNWFILGIVFLSGWIHAKVILIDPGHGGDESGAVGKFSNASVVYEKDLCLRLSLLIKEELSRSTNVYLTRSLDRTVGLQERADLADLLKADLFISIHFNSSMDKRSQGFEIYYLDNNSNVAANKVERAENLNLRGEELIVNQILVDLVVGQTVSHSKKLAAKVHSSVKPIIKNHRIIDRGVKPGLFYVLALSKRPGILIEAGFISNTEELAKISSQKYLKDLARSIAAGISSFLK